MKSHNLAHTLLSRQWVVVLCGGRGSRLGRISDTMPKPLVEVHGRPLIWYTVLNLYNHGFRRFIFPLGYKGEMIEACLRQEFEEYDCEMRFFNTGLETPIAGRLSQVIKIIPDRDDFFLTNGDTFFDFDILGMYQLHKRRNAFLTLSSVKVTSTYGLIVQDQEGRVTDFLRDGRVTHFNVENEGEIRLGFVNAGIVWINKQALQLIDLSTCRNFEQELFPLIIKRQKAVHYKLEGDWFAIDTPKDLNIINLRTETSNNIGEIVKNAKKNLQSRYQYKTRYFDNIETLKSQILNKTIIPHQVEIQPGPDKGPLCWMRCPYCYGNTARDTGERLAHERYEQILHQIAKGGVNKIVYAGYATDPLNYSRIEHLHKISLSYHQITGFHTKAIKVSEELSRQLTDPGIAPLSYFSVSVDAGSNKTYNQVHGLPESQSKIYDRVRANITRIADLREQTGAPLDLSTTYLINNINCEASEIKKAIEDLRNTGVDLIRFTFPQMPRGDSQNLEAYIPAREKVLEFMKELRPLIEEESSDRCQVLIMDLDADIQARSPRTLPCFARFIFPCIGFDGYLSHCSESSAPHFRDIALGNLNTTDFWDLYYNYDAADFLSYLSRMEKQMNTLLCRCDRKEHVVNQRIRESKIFGDL